VSKSSSKDSLEYAIQHCYKILSGFTLNNDTLDSLLPAFERFFLQSERLKIIKYLKAIFSFVFFRIDYSIGKVRNEIIFWPIQLHHVDTMYFLWKELKNQRIGYSVIVFRKDVYEKIKDLGIESDLVKLTRRRRGLKEALAQSSRVIYLMLQSFSISSNRFRVAYLNTIPIAKKGEGIPTLVNKLCYSRGSLKHIVGYDLSVIGWSIIKVAKRLNHQTYRIQNGAPNYNLAGFSEVETLFVWDDISKEAYRLKGYKGRLILTGNILLEEKLKRVNCELSNWIQSKNQFEKFIFVAFSGPGHNTTIKGHELSISILRDLVSNNRNICFLIRLHPKDSMEYYNILLPMCNVFFTDSISWNSNVDAEAVILLVLFSGIKIELALISFPFDFFKIIISFEKASEFDTK
jgi:hypothetical protein